MPEAVVYQSVAQNCDVSERDVVQNATSHIYDNPIGSPKTRKKGYCIKTYNY